MIYAIIALVALAVAAAWLCWRCATLRKALTKSQSRCQALQKDRAIRQNLQHVLDRREAEIRRLRARVSTYESDYQEMESKASDLSMSLFQESGRRILAEKEDGARRLKLEQMEQELAELRRKRREDADRQKADEARFREELERREAEAREREAELREQADAREAELRGQIDAQESEINRLRTINARRLARRTVPSGAGALDQVTLDDILK